ncbi:MAG: polymer-forming cytoskeletal protein [Chloroflexota bacterium]
MRRKIFRGLVIFLLIIMTMLLMAVPVFAADIRGGQSIGVSRDEVINDDLYVFGNNITIDGTIHGDIFTAGQTIVISSDVSGGVSGAGQTLTLSGEIEHGARLAGQTVTVNGSINRDLLAAASIINIASTASIGGDFIFGAATIDIDGSIMGNIRGGGNDVTINSTVDGDVNIHANSLTLTSNAIIRGNLTYTSNNEADIQPGATVAGSIKHEIPETREPANGSRGSIFVNIVFRVIGFVMALLTGIVLIFVATRRTSLIADSIGARPWSSFGWGALILFATPVAVIAVLITIIGIPLAIITITLYAVAIYLSQVFVGLFIGQLILGYFRKATSRSILIGAMALGLALLSLSMAIPYLGPVIGFLTALFGIGALLVSERRMRTVNKEVTLI